MGRKQSGEVTEGKTQRKKQSLEEIEGKTRKEID
jgi:hypothetical protein